MRKICYLLLSIISFNAKAQENQATNRLRDIAVSLDSFRSKVPIEKVHIHFDKPYYSLGDTIWMKAYVVNESNELSTLSKILYADLIDDIDSIKTTLRLPLTQGVGWGTITLSDSLLKAGNYHIRAYTNLMRNLGEEYFFYKNISIGNALPPTAKTNTAVQKVKPVPAKTDEAYPVKDNADNLSIQLFPEGGDLVNGIVSKVAFKVVGTDGLSREASGIVVDNNNQQITTFSTGHAGLGIFTLQPVAGNTYTALVKFNNGEKRVELPKPKDTGYSLSVTQSEVNIVVKISASKTLLNSGEISLVAQTNNTIQYTGKKQLTAADFITVIPKSRFPEGIMQLTLFSPDYQPVAERLVFIQHTNDHLKVNLVPDKPAYNQRGKVHLDVEVTDAEGKPVTGVFSLAVTNAEKVPYAEADEKTIFSNLLLTADLKGYIEQPNYYFTGVDSAKLIHLDNLLLTQGWRKFVWQDVLTNNFPALAYTQDYGTGISGKVLTDRGKPAVNARVALVFNAGNGIIIDTITNTQGRFNFDYIPLAKGTRFNIAIASAKKKQETTIELDQQPGPQRVTLKHLPEKQPADTYLDTYLANSRKRFDEMAKYGLVSGKLLKTVEINAFKEKETLKSQVTKNSLNLAGPLGTGKTFTFMDILPYTHDKVMFMAYLDAMAHPRFDKKRLLVVNGVKIIKSNGSQDWDLVDLPDPNDIAAVEIVDGGAGAMYGMGGSNGVMVITTKTGDIDYESYISEYYYPGSTKPKGLKKYVYESGYEPRREFYSPDYNNSLTNTYMADLRTTIYWNPNIITDMNGKASVDFFNADGTGTYKVITEGLDAQGKLGRQVFRYTVK